MRTFDLASGDAAIVVREDGTFETIHTEGETATDADAFLFAVIEMAQDGELFEDLLARAAAGVCEECADRESGGELN